MYTSTFENEPYSDGLNTEVYTFFACDCTLMNVKIHLQLGMQISSSQVMLSIYFEWLEMDPAVNKLNNKKMQRFHDQNSWFIELFIYL